MTAGVLATLAIGIGCVLPSIFYLVAAYQDDKTASVTAGTGAAVLIGVQVLAGATLGLFSWAASKAKTTSGIGAGAVLVIVLAVGWGLVSGFLGGLLIAMERHPTWDDA